MAEFPQTRQSAVLPRRQIATGVLAGVAAGLLAGLSFVATPAKFLAAGVPLGHLLAVGRVTFRASLAAEALMLLALLALAPGRLRLWVLAIAALLAAQHLLFMPALDPRTLAVMAGEVIPPSPLHAIWIMADVLRIGAYAALGAFALAVRRPS